MKVLYLYLVKNAFKMNKVFLAYDLMIRNKGSEKEEKGEGRKAMSSEELLLLRTHKSVAYKSESGASFHHPTLNVLDRDGGLS